MADKGGIRVASRSSSEASFLTVKRKADEGVVVSISSLNFESKIVVHPIDWDKIVRKINEPISKT